MAVFISHSSKDIKSREFGLLLQDLERMKYDVWLDQRLIGGQTWWDEILHQIRLCDAFLFVLSRSSLRSEASRSELHYASATNRPILPVKLTELSDWRLPESVARVQIIDYSDRSQSSESSVDCIFALSNALQGILNKGISPLPDPLPPNPDVPRSYLLRLQPLLHASELPFSQQERLLREIRMHLSDAEMDTEDRQALAEALGQFRRRPDIAYAIVLEIDQLLKTLSASLPLQPGELDPSEASPSEQRADPGARAPIAAPMAVDEAPERPPPIPEATGTVNPQNPTESKKSRFQAPGINVSRLGENLKAWYESQKLEAQCLSDGAKVMVQCRSKVWARVAGAGVALSVVLRPDDDDLIVEVGGAKWGDKIAATGVGVLVAFPIIFTAAIGSFKQATLPARTLRYIETMIPLCLEQPAAEPHLDSPL